MKNSEFFFRNFFPSPIKSWDSETSESFVIDPLSDEIQIDFVYLHTTFRVFRAFRVPVADANVERGARTLEEKFPSPLITIQKSNLGPRNSRKVL